MVKRRTLLGLLAATPTLGLPLRRLAAAAEPGPAAGDIQPLHRTPAQWRELLAPERYAILFQEGTEPAFSSPLNDEHRSGSFICAACYLPLFDSTAKYDSGTGWPSFTAPIDGRVGTKQDFRLIWPRTEYHCIRCGGHQGHVFNDGPRPRGQRWCNNGLALLFVPKGEPLPDLRS